MSRSHSTHSARLHALAAALCALLLLVALCLMAAAHAPWWALLATQGALLVTTASAGMWLDRSQAAGGRGQATEEGEPLTCVLYGPRGRAWPEALVTFSRPSPAPCPLMGACSCGVAGCVHLVVACLAQQAQRGGDDG